MSELTSALERINSWHQEKKGKSVFQPGLSRRAIDELVKGLQFPVPEEVYELYQWCNGSSETPAVIFHQQYVLPLETAVWWRKDRYGLNEGVDQVQDDPTWFPISKLWYDHAFYVVVLESKEASVVRNYDPELESYGIYYKNLTNLLLHNAEWLEATEYFEKTDDWLMGDRKTEARLNIKYRTRESIPPDDWKWAGR